LISSFYLKISGYFEQFGKLPSDQKRSFDTKCRLESLQKT